MDYRIGVDIGGTFTDIVLYDDLGGTNIAKVASTPEDPGVAVVSGILDILARHEISPSQVSEIVHGSTVGSNTILQKAGATTGLITTKGFRDVLEIGRIRTPGMFDLTWEKPVQLASRRHRKEVPERLSAQGEIVTPLDMDLLRIAAGELIADGCETVAICFLNSYIDPIHEIQARDLIEAEFPSLLVTASCDVLPEMKEYERTSTTVVNAYILTAMRAYLERLESELTARGFHAPLLIVNSAGGMMGVDAARSRPVFAVGSGPAGGVIGAARLAQATGLEAVIAFDMGGTTAKASIVHDGAPLLINEYEFREGISSPSRFIKGGGYMLKVPAIDIAEVGAGGGSLAWIDAGGMLQVGPVSAGADPGPAAYDQGNDKPTVTDANVCLGFIGESGLAGGSLTIKRELAEKAVTEHIAGPLGLSITEAALGIRYVANMNMARAIRSVTVERGLDPREMTLMAFGGGGPLHAADVALQLGIRKIVAPTMSGVFSSVGMLASDVEHSLVRATIGLIGGWSASELRARLEQLETDMRQRLKGEGFSDDRVELNFGADLRYIGQSADLTIAVDASALREEGGAALHAPFQRSYESVYGYCDEAPIELVNLRVTGRGLRERKLDFQSLSSASHQEEAQVHAARKVCFLKPDTWHDTNVLQRVQALDQPIDGPAVLVSYDTTIVVPPGAVASTDDCGSVVIDLSALIEGGEQ
jgi:N-methylhydantoinase A